VKSEGQNCESGCDSLMPVKAIALLSGGLDSTLAAVLVRRAGIDVIGLHVQTLFGTDNDRCRYVARTAERIGIPLRSLDLSEEQMKRVCHPRHGYGSGMNPCIDCRILMLTAAKRVMEEEGAQFVVTGEVLGQRPMSQHRRSLELVAEESGLGDRLLRPLSANRLPDTLPVRKEWIRRDHLLDLCGRSRHEQIALAARLGITEYPQPAGGCLLLEKAFAARLNDAFVHIGKEAMTQNDFRLLRYGRQFRLSEQAKVIVGRNEQENEILSGFATGRIVIEPHDVVGPLSLVEGSPTRDEVLLSACLAARYCDHDNTATLSMKISRSGEERIVEVAPLDSDDPRLSRWRIDSTTR